MAITRNSPAKVVDPAARMIAAKKKLIRKLESEIVDVRMAAEEEVKRIEFRIRQARTILNALEKGTLIAG